MQLPNHLVSLPVGAVGWLLALASLAWAVRAAPWPALRAEPMRIHLVLLATIFLAGMWSLSATLMPGLTLHFLGAATVTLVIGLELTLIAGLVAAVVSALVFGHGLAIAGWTFLLSGGALALSYADRLLMTEHAVFSVIAPEGAAAILERDVRRAPDVAGRLALTSADLRALGVVDEVIGEGQEAFEAAVAAALDAAVPGERAERFDRVTARWIGR